MVGADGSGFPASVIAGGVGRVQLELVVLVVSCEEEGSSEGARPAHLGVVLFDVADVHDQLLDGHAGSELDLEVLSGLRSTCAYSLNRLMR